MRAKTPLSHIPENEIQNALSAFKACAEGKSSLQEAYDYHTSTIKVGQESIYDIDHLDILSKVNIAPARQTIYHGKQVFTTTGAFAKKEIASKVIVDGKKANFSLSIGNVLKVLNLFLDIDFQGEDRTQYHGSIDQYGQVSNWLTKKIETEIEFFKTKNGLNQAPNQITLSKNGLHFHWQLDMKSGWSQAGLVHLMELDKKTQEEFCTSVGIQSLDDLEIQFFDDERKAKGIQSIIDTFFEKQGKKRGYDDKAKDVGTRKTREIGMWHTKDANNPWLMRPYQSNLLSKNPLTIVIPQDSEKVIKKEKQEFQKSIEQRTINFKYLTGDEVITIGKAGTKKSDSQCESMTVNELLDDYTRHFNKWKTRQNKINCVLDFASSSVAKPYETIGSAFVEKDEDGALYFTLCHPNKPKDQDGKEMNRFILPSTRLKKKIEKKARIKTLNLSYDDKGAIKKTAMNLLIILQNDPVLTKAYKLDMVRDLICIHHLLHTSSQKPNNGIIFGSSTPLTQQYENLIAQQPFSYILCEMLSEQDMTILKSYVEEVYDLSFDEITIVETMKTAFSASDNMDLKFNLLHDCFATHYSKWKAQNRPAVLDTWLPESLHVSKFTNPEYYDHLSIIGKKLLLGMCHRAYAFADPIKLELMLVVLGKAQNTGKSTMAETLVRSLLGVWGSETSAVGALDSRFILQTKQFDHKVGDQILSYAGKLIYLLEEFGSEQVGKKSANALKTMISEKSIQGRTPYAKGNVTLNFTHFIISTTNDMEVLHQGDGDQRRYLIVDLDKRGNDGNYAIKLDGKTQRVNEVDGNRGFIDNLKMNELLQLAWGEAYARAIQGEIPQTTYKECVSLRSVKHVLTGQPTTHNIYCEMPRLATEERKVIASFNRDYEMSNDRIDDVLYEYLSQSSQRTSFKYNEIDKALQEQKIVIKNPNIISNALSRLKYPLVKKKLNTSSIWVFMDAQGNILEENPYKDWKDKSDEDNPALIQAKKTAETISSMEQMIKDLQAQLQAKEQELQAQLQAKDWEVQTWKTKTQEAEQKKEVVIIESTKIDYGYTPELDDDDDDDKEFEIVPQGYVKHNDVQQLSNTQINKINEITQKEVQKQIEQSLQASSKPIHVPLPEVFGVVAKNTIVSPIDTLDLNNVDPKVLEGFKKKRTKKH